MTKSLEYKLDENAIDLNDVTQLRTRPDNMWRMRELLGVRDIPDEYAHVGSKVAYLDNLGKHFGTPFRRFTLKADPEYGNDNSVATRTYALSKAGIATPAVGALKSIVYETHPQMNFNVPDQVVIATKNPDIVPCMREAYEDLQAAGHVLRQPAIYALSEADIQLPQDEFEYTNREIRFTEGHFVPSFIVNALGTVSKMFGKNELDSSQTTLVYATAFTLDAPVSVWVDPKPVQYEPAVQTR